MKIIEILIAITLIYAILSILVSSLVEWRNSRKKARGNLLRKAIFQMLDDSLNLNYGQLLLNHPLVNSMNNKGENRPFQYLDSGIFADALIDIIGKQSEPDIPVNSTKNPIIFKPQLDKDVVIQIFSDGLAKMNKSSFRDMLESILLKSDGSYKKLKSKIEDWYNSNMDRTTGWYKRKQSKLFLFYGIVVALLLNIDSIHVFRVLSLDEKLRTNLVSVAEGVAEKYVALDSTQKATLEEQISIVRSSYNKIDNTKIDSQYYKTVIAWKADIDSLIGKLNYSDSIAELQLKELNEIIEISTELGLPIGYYSEVAPFSWRHKWFDKDIVKDCDIKSIKDADNRLEKYLYKRNYDQGFGNVILWIFGIIITGVMLSAGAPFWFDLLVKFVNIRKAGLKPSINNQKQQK